MDYGYIIEKAESVKKNYTYHSPKVLCREMGIVLLPKPMGRSGDSGKGCCFKANGEVVIVFNSEISQPYQNAIIYHEVGHIECHLTDTVYCFNDFSMFNESNKREIEANLFAAEMMMSDEDVLDALNDDGSFVTAAAKLFVPVEFIDFKFRLMNYKGYTISPPMFADADCLRDMKMICNDDFS
ncbi:MAG: ImmA/IrrE family metallo-endopeptidase [Ruminiclostridium sp.]|nr:ImmA/IrrE family metallo-endopeptidase [Ruminiclostridium sp.]